MPAAVTAPTASGAEAECPENRVKALDVLSWPRVGVRSPESPDRHWERWPRYDGKAVGTALARYYDPAIAQFLSRDPDVASTLSPYAYVAGDPLNAVDPAGLGNQPIAPAPSFEGPNYQYNGVTCNGQLTFAAALPTGDVPFPYVSGQKGGQPVKLPGAQGWRDAYGNRWVWDPNKNEWDVQHPNGTHTNVGTNGEITHGADNFPSQPQNFQLQLPTVNQSIFPVAATGSVSILLIIAIVALAPVGA
jgi:RHS repeat-associated protein